MMRVTDNRSKWLLLLLMILANIGGKSAYAQIEQPANLVPGLMYDEVTSSIWKCRGREIIHHTHWLIGEPIEFEGETVMPVYKLDSETGEWTMTIPPSYIKTEGSKAFIFDNGAISGERGWRLLYDFGIKPGEWTEVYQKVFPGFTHSKLKCVEVKTDPRYQNLKTITLVPKTELNYHADLEDEFWNCKWIIGIGATNGLFNPGAKGFGDSTRLNQVSLDGEDFLQPEY